ncbi:MAG: hypothetical protein R2727_06685 [Bacteroidales bacterium]
MRYFMADTIFSLNNNAIVYEDKKSTLIETFNRKDTAVIFEKQGRQWYHYQYMYMPRQNSLLYKGSVIRIVSDRTAEKMVAKKELIGNPAYHSPDGGDGTDLPKGEGYYPSYKETG